MEMIKKRNLLKKFFEAVAVFTVFMIAMGINARANDEVTVYYSDYRDKFNFYFYDTSDPYCTIGGKGGVSGDVVIPSKVIVKPGDGVSSVKEENKTYRVVSVGSFGGNTAITSIKFGEGLEEIAASAFLGCTGLKGDVVIPDSVKTLGGQAFRGCTNLKGKLTIGKGLTKIPISAFFDCGFTGTLTIPENITEIEAYAFQNCRGFTGSLTIPASVVKIGYDAFKDCTGFNGTLTLLCSASERQGRTFNGCKNFSALNIADGFTRIEAYEFEGCSGLKGTLKLPASLTYIDSYAFSDCKGLTGTLNLPSKMTQVCTGVFSGCSGFTGLVLPSGITLIKSSAFKDCTGMIGTLSLPKTLITVESSAFQNCGFTGDLTLPKGLTDIGGDSFACPDIDGTLTVPSTLNSSYVDKAFSGMYKVEKVVNNSSANIYLANNFIDEDDHKSFFVKSGTTERIVAVAKVNGREIKYTIGKGTYLRNGGTSHKHKLVKTAAKEPKGKTNGNIAYWTCSDCGKYYADSSGKKEIKKNGWVILAKNKEFKDSSSKGKYKVTSSGSKNPTVKYVTCTNNSATNVSIPATVKYGAMTYKVTEVANGALKGKTKITKITVGSNVKKIGDKAFDGCSKATKISLGKNVTSIGTEVFGNCSALNELTLPANTITLGKKFMNKCNPKMKLTIKSKKLDKTSVKAGAFTGMTNKKTVTIVVPKGMKNGYQKLFVSKGLGKNVTVKAAK